MKYTTEQINQMELEQEQKNLLNDEYLTGKFNSIIEQVKIEKEKQVINKFKLSILRVLNEVYNEAWTDISNEGQ